MTCCLAALDGTGQLDGATEQQQLFSQRGLARVGVGDDGEGTAPLRLVGDTAHAAGCRVTKTAILPQRQVFCSGCCARQYCLLQQQQISHVQLAVFFDIGQHRFQRCRRLKTGQQTDHNHQITGIYLAIGTA